MSTHFSLLPSPSSLLMGRAADAPREARSSAPSTHSSLLPPPFSLFSTLPTEAHCIVSTHFSLLPSHGTRGGRAARGALKRAIHALLPPPFSLLPSPYSLLSTLPTEAHCIVSTHYPLLPPPYSLLLTYCHTCDKPPVSCDDAWQMPLRTRTCLRTRVVRRFPRLSTGYMSMRLWPWP